MWQSFEPFVDAEISYRRERIAASYPKGRRNHVGLLARGLARAHGMARAWGRGHGEPALTPSRRVGAPATARPGTAAAAPSPASARHAA